jgi:hypothetical protein
MRSAGEEDATTARRRHTDGKKAIVIAMRQAHMKGVGGIFF